MKFAALKFVFASVVLLLCAEFSYTQTRCQTDQYQKSLLEDSAYNKWFKKVASKVKNASSSRFVNCANPFIIPVAVHYGGDIDDSNPTCLIDKALEQIAVLNADFAASNSDLPTYCILYDACCEHYPSNVLSKGTCLQFCLATDNHPSCEPSGNLIGGYAITVDQHAWPMTSNNCWEGYLNIFVSTGTGNLGTAPIAGGANPNGNGIIVESFAFGGPTGGCNSGGPIDTDPTYNLGRTLTHEVGHYFGLDHIFDGCGAGDNIGDTPSQDEENYGCPQISGSTCLSTANNSCGTQDFFFNYMDYVNDACMFMFTRQQSLYMYNVSQLAGTGSNAAFVNNATHCDASTQPDYNPTYPNGCPITSAIPESMMLPFSSNLDVCSNRAIDFKDNSQGCDINAWSWTFSGAGVSPTSSTLQNPSVVVTSNGVLNATLVTSNPTGTDATPASETFTINLIDSADPNCNECNEAYFDSGSWFGDYDNNEDIITTLCAQTGENVTVTFASFNVEYEANCQYDRLEVFDGTSLSSPYMGYFCGNGLANAPGGGVIESSQSCLTFRFRSDVYVVESGWEGAVTCAFTVPLELLTFTAQLDFNKVNLDWKMVSKQSLSFFEIQRKTDEAFYTIGRIDENQGDENELDWNFVDDSPLLNQTNYYRLKMVDPDGSFQYSKIKAVDYRSAKVEFEVFPNPTAGIFYLRNPASNGASINLTFYDRLGNAIRSIDNITITDQIELNISDFPNGVYTIKIIRENSIDYKQLVVVH